MLDSLLGQIYEQMPEGLIVQIHNDGSVKDYADVIRKYYKMMQLRYFGHNHFGKKRYWELINKVFWHRARAKYYIMLPDDDILGSDFFTDIIETWEGINHPDKICMMPSINIERKWVPCWTGQIPIREGAVYDCAYVDMRFICRNEFFRAVGEIQPIPLTRWQHSEELSTGVGAQISHMLHDNGLKMYISAKDMTYQVDHPMMMNKNVKDRKW